MYDLRNVYYGYLWRGIDYPHRIASCMPSSPGARAARWSW